MSSETKSKMISRGDMPVSFTFNGVKKDYLRVLVGLERPAWAPIEEEILEIPGRPGGIITKQHTKIRRLNIPVRVYKRGFDSLEELEEDLAAWLVTDEPKPLEFDHKPNRVYYAKVTGELIFTEYPQWADGVISFICPDPYKYGPEIEAVFPSDVVTLTNKGTAEAEPVFELEVKEPVTFAMISNQDDEYMLIGKPVDELKNIPVKRYETILNDPLNSLVGWTEADYVENGTVQGSMGAIDAFYGESFGTPIPNTFYGPAVKKSISEVLKNFSVEANVTFGNAGNPNQTGRVEIYLLDTASNIIGKMTLMDTYSQQIRTVGQVRIGDENINYYLIDFPGDRTASWTDFRGVLRIRKLGNRWEAYVAKINRLGQHYARKFVQWEDTNNYFTNKELAQIQIHIARWGQNDIPNMWVHHLKVEKINPITENEIPYIASPGDIITFDHKNADILINGESRMDLKQLGASFFKLKKGENRLVVSPDDSFGVKCKYRPTYL